MTTLRDTEAALLRLNEALAELRQTVSEAHAARKDLTNEVRKRRQEVADALADEVARQVGEATRAVLAEMREAAGAVISRLERDWRQKLGLT